MELHGSTFKLRSLEKSDREALASLANNKKIWQNLRDIFPYPYSLDDADFYINLIQQEERAYTFAIEYQGRLCGMVGIVPMQDVYRLTAEIGYWLGEPFWGKGIMSEAVTMITEHAFDHFEFVRIHCGVFSFNTGSMKVLEKCGYKVDGIFKQSIIKNGEIYDEHRYSKIKE